MLHPLQQKHLVLQVHRAQGLPLQPDGSEPDVHVELCCGGPASGASRLVTSCVRRSCAPQWGSQQPLLTTSASSSNSSGRSSGCAWVSSVRALLTTVESGAAPACASVGPPRGVWEAFVLREDDLLESGMVVAFKVVANRPAQGGWLSSASQANIAQAELDLGATDCPLLEGLRKGRTALLHLPLHTPEQGNVKSSNSSASAGAGTLRRAAQQQPNSMAADGTDGWEQVAGRGGMAGAEAAYGGGGCCVAHPGSMREGPAGLLVVSAWLQDTWAQHPQLGGCLVPDLAPVACLPLTCQPPGSVLHSQLATAYCEPCTLLLRIRLIGVWGLTPASGATASSGQHHHHHAGRRMSLTQQQQQQQQQVAAQLAQLQVQQPGKDGGMGRAARELGVRLQVQGDQLLHHATALWTRFRSGAGSSQQQQRGSALNNDKGSSTGRQGSGRHAGGGKEGKGVGNLTIPPSPTSLSHAASTVSPTPTISRSPSGLSYLDEPRSSSRPDWGGFDVAAGAAAAAGGGSLLPEGLVGSERHAATPPRRSPAAPSALTAALAAQQQQGSGAGSRGPSAGQQQVTGVNSRASSPSRSLSMSSSVAGWGAQPQQEEPAAAGGGSSLPRAASSVRHVVVSNSGVGAPQQVSHVLNALEEAGFSTTTGATDTTIDATYCWLKVSYEGQEHTSRMAHLAPSCPTHMPSTTQRSHTRHLQHMQTTRSSMAGSYSPRASLSMDEMQPGTPAAADGEVPGAHAQGQPPASAGVEAGGNSSSTAPAACAPHATAAAQQQFGSHMSAAWAADEPPVLLAATRPLPSPGGGGGGGGSKGGAAQSGGGCPQLELELWATKDSKSRGRSIAKLYTSLARLLEAAGANTQPATSQRQAAGAEGDVRGCGGRSKGGGKLASLLRDAPHAALEAVSRLGGVPAFMDPTAWPQGDVLMQGKCENGASVAVALYVEVVDADARAHALQVPLIDAPPPPPPPALRLAPDGFPLQQSWQEPSPRPPTEGDAQLLQQLLSPSSPPPPPSTSPPSQLGGLSSSVVVTGSASRDLSPAPTLRAGLQLSLSPSQLHVGQPVGPMSRRSGTPASEAHSHPVHVVPSADDLALAHQASSSSALGEREGAGEGAQGGHTETGAGVGSSPVKRTSQGGRGGSQNGHANGSTAAGADAMDGLHKVSSRGVMVQLRLSGGGGRAAAAADAEQAAAGPSTGSGNEATAQQGQELQLLPASQVADPATTAAAAGAAELPSLVATASEGTASLRSMAADSYCSACGGGTTAPRQPALAVEAVGDATVAWCTTPPVLTACLPGSDPTHHLLRPNTQHHHAAPQHSSNTKQEQGHSSTSASQRLLARVRSLAPRMVHSASNAALAAMQAMGATTAASPFSSVGCNNSSHAAGGAGGAGAPYQAPTATSAAGTVVRQQQALQHVPAAWQVGSQVVGHWDLLLHSVALAAPAAAAAAAAGGSAGSTGSTGGGSSSQAGAGGDGQAAAGGGGGGGNVRPTDCYVIMRCGVHWVVTRPRAITPGQKPGVWGLAVRLPLIHPAQVLTLSLLKAGTSSNDSAARKSVRSMMMGIHLQQQGDSLLGRLRLRASQLQPGVLHAGAVLPLLGERGQSRGPSVVAHATLTAMVSYPHLFPLLATYLTPPVYGPLQLLQQGCVAGDDMRSPWMGHTPLAVSEELVERRRRRVVLGWLGGGAVSPALHHRTARRMLEDGRHDFTLSRTGANWRRIQAALGSGEPLAEWWKEVQSWRRPWLSGCVAVLIVLAGVWPSRACALGTLWGAISLVRRRKALGPACGAPPLMLEDSALEGASITVATTRPPRHLWPHAYCYAHVPSASVLVLGEGADGQLLLQRPSGGEQRAGGGGFSASHDYTPVDGANGTWSGGGGLTLSSSGYFDNPSSSAPPLSHTNSDASLWLGGMLVDTTSGTAVSPRAGQPGGGAGLPLSPVGSPRTVASGSGVATSQQPQPGVLPPSALDAGFWGMPAGAAHAGGLHVLAPPPDRSLHHGGGSEGHVGSSRAVSPAPSRLSHATAAAAVATQPPLPPAPAPPPAAAATVPLDPLGALRAQYDNMVRFMLTVQNLMDGMASAVERVAALTAWTDPFATGLLVVALTLMAVALWVVGLPALLAMALLFDMRPPALRDPWPAPPANLLGYLPSRADHMG